MPDRSLDPNYAPGATSLLSRFCFPYNASQVIPAASRAYKNQENQYHMYAVSQELVVFGNVEAVFSTVPIPATAWLFGYGLIGLTGFAGRKKS